MTQYLTKPIDSLLGRVQRRFHKSRAGSVLILVVALLVLLALIGTAFITTTRIDRVASVQNTKNVQIELLVDGIVNLAVAAVRDDLYDTQALPLYRPADMTPASWNGYEHFESLGGAGHMDLNTPLATVPSDLWLGNRYPRTLDVFNSGVALPANNGTNFPFWDSITYPMNSTNLGNGLVQYEFRSPNSSTPFQFSFPFRVLPNSIPPGAQYYTMKPLFRPTVIESPANSGKFYPGLAPYHVAGAAAGGPILTPSGAPFIAADADGDGVADSGMWQLPVGHIDGVSYYAAMRIIDSNSAVNVNTAISNKEFNGVYDSMSGGSPITPRYYFPASVAMAEMLKSYNPVGTTVSAQSTEMGKLFEALCQGTLPKGGLNNGVRNGTAADDQGAPRGDFAYQSLGDLMYNVLGARLANPGNVDTGAAKAQAMSINESIALAYHFLLLNPDASPTLMETTFAKATAPQPDSIYRGVDNFNAKTTSYPQTAAGILAWYNNNFFYHSEANALNSTQFMQRRPMLVASNPVSPNTPSHPIDTYAALAGVAGLPVLPGPPPEDLYLAKTSINQASFPELWRAFWQVTSQQQVLPGIQPFAGSPFDYRTHVTITKAATVQASAVRVPGVPAPADLITFNNPYIGTRFVDNTDAPYVPAGTRNYNPKLVDKANPTIPAVVSDLEYHPSRMFRSSLRGIPNDTVLTDLGYTDLTPRFNSAQMALLRSAIAAVNAEDMRDSDNDVTARRVVLQAAVGNILTPMDVIVYGNEPQPFITEVFCDTDVVTDRGGGQGANQYGYVAIELYNPFPFDIAMTNWKLVALDRRSEGTAPYIVGAARAGGGGATSPAGQLPLDETTLIADFTSVGAPGADPLPTSVHIPGSAAPGVPAGASVIVPAKGYLLMESYNPYGGAVVGVRPPATGLPLVGPIPGTSPGTASGAAPGQVNVISVPGLAGLDDGDWGMPEWPTPIRSAFNRELVILKPRRADGQRSQGIYPVPAGAGGAPLPYDDTMDPAFDVDRRNLRDCVPVDSFDFTGVNIVGPAAPLGRVIDANAISWHYVRQNVNAGGGEPNWKFVYPGRYDATKSYGTAATGAMIPRQQGTSYSVMWDPSVDAAPWDGTGSMTHPASFLLPAENIASSYPRCTFPLQLIPTWDPRQIGTPTPPPPALPAPNKPLVQAGAGPQPVRNYTLYGAPDNMNFYPFGGFGRKGDILNVPFVGAYRVAPQAFSPFAVTELNSVTMDSVFAEDTDLWDDPGTPDLNAVGGVDTLDTEQIGHFAPIRIRAGGAATYADGWSDYSPSQNYPTINDTNPPAGFATDPAGPLWIDDYAYDPSYRPNANPGAPANSYFGADWEPYWRYRWALDLFDYLDVRSPATDTLPNYPMQRPWENSTLYYPGDLVSWNDGGAKQHTILMCVTQHTSVAAGTTFTGFPANFSAIGPVGGQIHGTAVQNGEAAAAFPGTGIPAENAENNVGDEGLVNINTADWRVLATLPLVVQGPTDPNPGQIDNRATTTPPFRNDNLAKAIVYYRDVDADPNPNIVAPHGPFRSIFELNKVIDLRPNAPSSAGLTGYPAQTAFGFQNGYGTIQLSTAFGTFGPDDAHGDFSPLGVDTTGGAATQRFRDAVRGDVEERFCQLNRVSNLITTRSDSFTVYILVQGWRDAGTPNAELVVQRRVGYFVDRSKYSPNAPGQLITTQFLNN